MSKLYRFSYGSMREYAWGHADEASKYAARTGRIYEPAMVSLTAEQADDAEHLDDLLLRTPSVAEQVAKALDYNERHWETYDGISFNDLIEEHSAYIRHIAGNVRYEFADGSAIVDTGNETWEVE